MPNGEPPEIAMKIIDARGAPKVNMLTIECNCGNQFEHRADVWGVKCPNCLRQDHLQRMRTLSQMGEMEG